MGISSLIYDSWKMECQFRKYDGMLPMLEVVNLKGKVLDVGIGSALFEEYLRGKGIILDVVGIDEDPIMLKTAAKKGYNAVAGSAERLPFEDNEFDFVVCLDTLHATEARRAINEMKRVLKPRGHILLSKFCNVFNKAQAMEELEELAYGMQLISKKVVGRSDDELSAALLCRKE
ncbi:MAG: class I SAM-dependent methyltransferase [Candidatus Diapherotrites archaeon]|nr:class I SAM-dependent methyltransferase [Candidatus Diapherotrites archaeon]